MGTSNLLRHPAHGWRRNPQIQLSPTSLQGETGAERVPWPESTYPLAYPVWCLQVTGRRLWKNVYDELGGSPGSTSAATCTRRHYERYGVPHGALHT